MTKTKITDALGAEVEPGDLVCVTNRLRNCCDDCRELNETPSDVERLSDKGLVHILGYGLTSWRSKDLVVVEKNNRSKFDWLRIWTEHLY